MRTWLILAGFLLLTALPAAAADLSGWVPSGTVEVRAERGQPSGHVAWEFRLRWERQPDRSFRFEITAPRVHALNGRPATLEELRPMALAVESLERMTPAWFVSPAGEFLEVEEPDSTRSPEAALEASEGRRPLEAGERAALVALLSSNAYRSLARSRPAQLWELWFGNWELSGEDTFERRGEASFRGRGGIPTRELWQVESLLAGTPRARLQVTCNYELAGDPPAWLDEELGPHSHFERRGERQALLQPDDRRPWSVGESSSAAWVDAAGQRQEEFEQTVHSFAWR